jgi:hypothetical protein
MTILAKIGVWTNNFPDQHYANGAAMRADRTSLQAAGTNFQAPPR